MINFSKYKTIFWDFDGVLMDSMPVRDKGFEIVLKNYPPEQVSLLMAFHRKNGGLSRYVKFRYFFEEVRNEPISETQLTALATSFSTLMKQELTNASLLINDSLSFVKKYSDVYQMHIVSGSDGNELNYLCKELEIDKYFKSIQGSPTPKKELVRELLKSCSQQNCVLIGDSNNDYEAAMENGIDFIGYNNIHLSTLPNYLRSFKPFYET